MGSSAKAQPAPTTHATAQALRQLCAVLRSTRANRLLPPLISSKDSSMKKSVCAQKQRRAWREMSQRLQTPQRAARAPGSRLRRADARD
jgi:hypothetical protein